jgi:hypothetical protein
MIRNQSLIDARSTPMIATIGGKVPTTVNVSPLVAISHEAMRGQAAELCVHGYVGPHETRSRPS